MAMFCYVEPREYDAIETVELVADDLEGLSFALHSMSCDADSGTCVEGPALSFLRGAALLMAESLKRAALDLRGGDAA